jgi:AbrB family looped-hinge helix DNA binding protein
MAVMANVILDRFGRVLIPLAVRRSLGLKPGDELEVRVARDEAGFSVAVPRPATNYRDRVLVFYGEPEREDSL